MFQNICDRAPAIPFSSAEERQCRQFSAAVTRCPRFLGNHCRQALERHVDYLVYQCELVCTRAMSHHTIGGGRTLGRRRPHGRARLLYCAPYDISHFDRKRSFGLLQHSTLWQISAPCPHWHVGWEIRNRTFCFQRLDGVPSTQRRLRRFLLNT
jgi:hypothetical protein